MIPFSLSLSSNPFCTSVLCSHLKQISSPSTNSATVIPPWMIRPIRTPKDRCKSISQIQCDDVARTGNEHGSRGWPDSVRNETSNNQWKLYVIAIRVSDLLRFRALLIVDTNVRYPVIYYFPGWSFLILKLTNY